MYEDGTASSDYVGTRGLSLHAGAHDNIRVADRSSEQWFGSAGISQRQIESVRWPYRPLGALFLVRLCRFLPCESPLVFVVLSRREIAFTRIERFHGFAPVPFVDA